MPLDRAHGHSRPSRSLTGSLISQVHIGGANYTKQQVKKNATGNVVKDKNGKPVMEPVTITQNAYANIRTVLNNLGFGKAESRRKTAFLRLDLAPRAGVRPG